MLWLLCLRALGRLLSAWLARSWCGTILTPAALHARNATCGCYRFLANQEASEEGSHAQPHGTQPAMLNDTSSTRQHSTQSHGQSIACQHERPSSTHMCAIKCKLGFNAVVGHASASQPCFTAVPGMLWQAACKLCMPQARAHHPSSTAARLLSALWTLGPGALRTMMRTWLERSSGRQYYYYSRLGGGRYHTPVPANPSHAPRQNTGTHAAFGAHASRTHADFPLSSQQVRKPTKQPNTERKTGGR